MEDTGKTRLFIAMGRKDGMTPKNQLNLLSKSKNKNKAILKCRSL